MSQWWIEFVRDDDDEDDDDDTLLVYLTISDATINLAD